MGRSRKSNAAGGLAALVILCVTSLVLFTIYVREGDEGPLHTIQLGASEVLRPVRGFFGLAASPFQTAGERVAEVLDAGEREELEQKAREYEEGAAEAARLRQENGRLRALLEGEQTSFEYAPLARIVAPVGGQLTERVVINVGTNDGVGPEQPVVVGNNILVGRTTDRVTPNTAEVLLVTDRNFAAGVRLLPPEVLADEPEQESTTPAGESTTARQEATTPSRETTTPRRDPTRLRQDLASAGDSHGEGLLRTNLEGYIGVDYVDLNAEAEQGDFVVTSGRAGDRELLFPPGLLVGTVESVSSQDIDQYKKIVVTPTLKADDLEEVRVIVGW
ncbi:MAG: rod shape-determining protein MreC [Actinomycetota bacterium]|nr:rod shape-determining protein MreC [Actinomycetota bacterium]